MVEGLNMRLANLERGLLKGEALEQKIEEVVDKKLAEVMDEQKEIEKRKMNVIIWNLRESAKAEVAEKKEDDLAAAKSLLAKLVPLDEDEVVDPVRLGKVSLGNRPRMLRVTIKKEEKRKEILRKAPELNRTVADEKKRIYINPDYTQKQREQYKALREEKKRRIDAGEENLAIRNGKIVTVKPRQQAGMDDHGNKDGRAVEEGGQDKH
jgi:hypothetical protein